MIIRLTSALVLLVSLGWAAAFLWAAIVGDRAMGKLIETYGDRPGFQWYRHEPARELFHGELGEASSILYFSFFVAPIVMVTSVVASLLLVKFCGQRGGLSAIGGMVMTALMIFIPIGLYSDSISAIRSIVE
jgi:hypothetical protein